MALFFSPVAFYPPANICLTFYFHYSKICYTVHRQLFQFVEPFVIKGDVVLLRIFPRHYRSCDRYHPPRPQKSAFSKRQPLRKSLRSADAAAVSESAISERSADAAAVPAECALRYAGSAYA